MERAAVLRGWRLSGREHRDDRAGRDAGADPGRRAPPHPGPSRVSHPGGRGAPDGDCRGGDPAADVVGVPERVRRGVDAAGVFVLYRPVDRWGGGDGDARELVSAREPVESGGESQVDGGQRDRSGHIGRVGSAPLQGGRGERRSAGDLDGSDAADRAGSVGGAGDRGYGPVDVCRAGQGGPGCVYAGDRRGRRCGRGRGAGGAARARGDAELLASATEYRLAHGLSGGRGRDRRHHRRRRGHCGHRRRRCSPTTVRVSAPRLRPVLRSRRHQHAVRHSRGRLRPGPERQRGGSDAGHHEKIRPTGGGSIRPSSVARSRRASTLQTRRT